jgi:hypothetical protein
MSRKPILHPVYAIFTVLLCATFQYWDELKTAKVACLVTVQRNIFL